MDLIHPQTKADVVDALQQANAGAQRLLVVGGRRHADKGNPSPVEGELWTTQLDRLVSHEPAEMIAVVEGGIRVGELRERLAEGGQEWPSDAPDEATVGGVLASAASSPRRLRVGALRDTVLETEIVTGDGRFVRSGARTVKNVTGYDLHKLVVGSLGTLGVIVQVALKVRPLPESRRTVRVAGGFDRAAALLGALPAAAAVLVTSHGVEVRLEGWREEVEEQTEAASGIADLLETLEDEPFPASPPWASSPIVAEVSAPPSKLAELTVGEAWGALAGVGLAWVGLEDEAALGALRERVRVAGGIAPVVLGPGGLGDETVPAPDVQRRLKEAFDPNEVLAPGRGWGGI